MSTHIERVYQNVFTGATYKFIGEDAYVYQSLDGEWLCSNKPEALVKILPYYKLLKDF